MCTEKRPFCSSSSVLVICLIVQVLATTGEKNIEEIYPDGVTQCIFKNGTVINAAALGGDGHLGHVILTEPTRGADIIVDGDGNEFVNHCSSCFALFTEDPRGTPQIIGQGCWLTSDGCDDTACVAKENGHDSSSNNLLSFANHNSKTKFCCCKGDRCNAVVSVKEEIPTVITCFDGSSERSDEEAALMLDSGYVALIIIAAYLVSFVCLCGLGIYVKRICFGRDKRNNSHDCENGNVPLLQPISPAESLFHHTVDFSSCLHMDVLLSEGKFGVCVYKAHMEVKGAEDKVAVAVKVFPRAHKNYFECERSVYQLLKPKLNNNEDNALFAEFMGSQEDVAIDGIKYDCLLVMSYAEHGSLNSFLKSQTVSWAQLCRMLHDLSNGLSHLHADGDSKVDKANSSSSRPAICHRNFSSHHILVNADLSCRIADFSNSHALSNNNQRRLQELSGDVGAIRYLCPELLEGFVNLRDSAASLKQADVYALGLVFWEVSRRCKDLYQGCQVPAFALAFEQELGSASEEPTREEMALLVSKKKARPLFPEVWKDSNPAVKLLKETVEYSWDQDGEARLTALCILERCKEMHSLWLRRNNNSSGSRGNDLELQRRNAINGECFRSNDISPVEPLLQLAQMNLVQTPSHKNDNLISRQNTIIRIQPHQGTNPCRERNMMNEEMGNVDAVMHKSSKDTAATVPAAVESGVVTPVQQPTAAPIPYLVNDFGNEVTNHSSSAATELSNSNVMRKATNVAKSNLERYTSPSGNNSNGQQQQSALLGLM